MTTFRRASIALALAALAPLVTSGSPQKGTPADRPNIVFILSDDHAHNALGIAGHPHLKTPHLDRLAREGIWFRQSAVVTPLCAPSRAAFLTGLYGHTSGFRANNVPWPERFPPSFLSVAKDAGYRTAFIGKKHIYNTDEPLPGIDRWVSFVNQGRFVNPAMNVDGDRRTLTGANGDLLTDFAAEFIRTNRQAPFAMVVGYKEAHSQQTAPPRFNSMFEDVAVTLPPTWNEDKSTKPAFFGPQPNIPDSGFAEPNPAGNNPPDQTKRDQLAIKKIRNYYRCIAALDAYVGRIRQALEETGRLDNTILVFGGDNGYFLGDHGRFEKMTPHEESVRIPLLMRFPAAIRPATVSDELVLNIDLAPTLYDLAGLKGPALDGRSLRPILEGRGRARNWRQETYIEWQGAEGRVEPGTAGYIFSPTPPGVAAAPALLIPTWRALRTRDYKYAVYLNGDLSELYDLRADPRETRNLINDPKEQERISVLHRRLRELADETRDPLKDLIPSVPSRTRLVPETTISIAGAEGSSSTFNGRWTVGLENLQAISIELRVDGDRVAGRLTVATQVVDILGGSLSGNQLTFRVNSPNGGRTITFSGTLTGDEISFARTVEVSPGGTPGGAGIFGVGGPKSFVARRTK
jgi:arylsulfatase A-like enzyme